MRFAFQTSWIRVLIEIVRPDSAFSRYRVGSVRTDGPLQRQLQHQIKHIMRSARR